MKKLLILTNVIWFLLISMFALKSCNSTPEKTIKNSESEDVIINYSDKKFNALPLETAMALAKNYQGRMERIYEDEGLKDAYGVWFGLEELENFIWIIRHYTEKANKHSDLNISPKDLGVRIYYGKYPNRQIMERTTAFMEVDPSYADKHMVFMVPTFDNGEDHINFDPKTSSDNIIEGKAKELTPLSKQFGRDFITVNNEDGPAILDHANLCPPCWE